jgi:hypothetical protein
MLRWKKLNQGMGFSRVGLELNTYRIIGDYTHGLYWSWYVDNNYVTLHSLPFGPRKPETMWPDLGMLGLSPEHVQELKDDLPYYILEKQMESV